MVVFIRFAPGSSPTPPPNSLSFRGVVGEFRLTKPISTKHETAYPSKTQVPSMHELSVPNHDFGRHRLLVLLARKRAEDLALRLNAERDDPVGPVAESAHGRLYDPRASPRRYDRKRKRVEECRFLLPPPPKAEPRAVPRDPRRRPRKRAKTNN